MTQSRGNGGQLQRFIEAQQGIHDRALAELRAGAKCSHWMWFVFPQIAGLGRSGTARYYAIADLAEARAYLADPVLGARLRECTEAALAVQGRTALAIFGSVDTLKFRSSLTLFAEVAGPGSVFEQALAKYFDGEPDAQTLAILADQKRRR